MKISKTTYNLFCKHGNELLWVSDPIRVPRPKGTNKTTDEEFNVLESLDENLELFYNDLYSKKLKKEYADKIEFLKFKVEDEVYERMKEKYNNNVKEYKYRLPLRYLVGGLISIFLSVIFGMATLEGVQIWFSIIVGIFSLITLGIGSSLLVLFFRNFNTNNLSLIHI